MKLNEKIKQKRRQHDMTLDEVAVKMGISKQTVQKYESGAIYNILSLQPTETAIFMAVFPFECYAR